MTKYYDNLETRSHDERTTDLSKQLPSQIQNAKENSEAFSKILHDIDHQEIESVDDLIKLPVLRKSDLVRLQA